MQYSKETKSMPPAKFLTISANLLHNAFIKAGRTAAKRVYRDIEAGKVVPLTYLELEDKSMVRFDLSLNHKLYRGQLNFTSFRNGVALFIMNAGEVLREPDKLRIYQNQDNPRSIVFGVLAISTEDGEPSVLSLVADSSGEEAVVHLQLTYLDSVQFQGREVADTTADSPAPGDGETA
jgi:hypothetical protein